MNYHDVGLHNTKFVKEVVFWIHQNENDGILGVWEANWSLFYSQSLNKMDKNSWTYSRVVTFDYNKGEHSRDVEYGEGEIYQPLPSL